MPASSSDLIDVALFSAFSRKTRNEEEKPYIDTEDATVPSLKEASLIDFELDGPYKKHQLNSGSTSFHILQEKYGTLKEGNLCNKNSKLIKNPSMAHPKNEDKLEEPRTVLWSPEKVVLGWRKTFPPGAGIVNLGNTCYMNSSLQALFHIPSLANWLLEEASTHIASCESNIHNASFCSICSMMRTLKQALDRSNNVIKPSHIHNKLKCIGKTLIYGRQEDAHEFIKMLLDHMEKSFLTFMRATRLDHRSKETTPLNQIFGGYLRQQVICPLCCYVSTTFSHFQDLVLDIRSVGSVDEALNLYFRKETLDSDNAYKCEKCHKKVPATKRHLIEKAPHVLLLQLKRFTISGGKITKHVNIQKTIDISRYVNGVKSTNPNGTGPYYYKLVSMVIHIGGSQHGGHYTAIAEASNKTMFEFDDSMVRPISLQSALLRNPYILFYEMVHKPKNPSSIKQVVRQNSEKTLLRQNGADIKIPKPMPTSLSTNNMSHKGVFLNSSSDIGVVVNRNSHSQNKKSASPAFLNHKEREKISFAFKATGHKGHMDKFIKRNNINSSNEGSLTNNSSSHGSTDSRSSLVPYNADSEDSDNDQDSKKLANGHMKNGHSSNTRENVKEIPENVVVNGIKNKSFYSEKSENKENHCGKNDLSNNQPRLLNGHSKDVKKQSDQDVTDKPLTNGEEHGIKYTSNSHLEANEGSPGSSSSCSSSMSQGCTVSEKSKNYFKKKENDNLPGLFQRQKPELEKSLSHDSVLPFKGRLNDKAETSSLKSKSSSSGDSNHSDKSKSMKKSLLSFFKCGSSTHTPEISPEHEDIKKNIELEDTLTVDIKKDSDISIPKRNRDISDEPTSPSKKCKPGERIKFKADKNTSSTNGKKVNSNNNFSSSSHSSFDVRNGGNNSGGSSHNSGGNSHNSGGNSHNSGGTQNGENFSQEENKYKMTKCRSKSEEDENLSSDDDDDSERTAKRNSEKSVSGGKWGRNFTSREILNSNVVEMQWNRNITDLSDRITGSKNLKVNSRDADSAQLTNFSSWNQSKNMKIVEELKTSGDYSFGCKVETWNGSRSLLDEVTLNSRNEARKRTADEIYNEELDAGKIPKKKYRNYDMDNKYQSKENPFQQYQEINYNSRLNHPDHKKSWNYPRHKQEQRYHSHQRHNDKAKNYFHKKNNFHSGGGRWVVGGTNSSYYNRNSYHGNGKPWQRRSDGDRRGGPYRNNHYYKKN